MPPQHADDIIPHQDETKQVISQQLSKLADDQLVGWKDDSATFGRSNPELVGAGFVFRTSEDAGVVYVGGSSVMAFAQDDVENPWEHGYSALTGNGVQIVRDGGGSVLLKAHASGGLDFTATDLFAHNVWMGVDGALLFSDSGFTAPWLVKGNEGIKCNEGIGMFNVNPPASKPPTPADLPGVIAILQGVGMCA